MPQSSKREYEEKLETVRTAMLRGFTDREIMAAEEVSRRALSRYQTSIKQRDLKFYRVLQKDEARELFIKQIRRWEDVIRQANRRIMSGQEKYIGALLSAVSHAAKNILDYSMRVGVLPEVPTTLEMRGEVDVRVKKQFLGILAVQFQDKPLLLNELIEAIERIEAKK